TRPLLLTSTAIALVSAVVVTTRVIPPVRETWTPNTEGAEGAVPASWVSVVGNVVYAVVLTFAALIGKAGRLVRGTAVVLSVGALVQAVAYLNGGSRRCPVPAGSPGSNQDCRGARNPNQ